MHDGSMIPTDSGISDQPVWEAVWLVGLQRR